MQVGDRPGRCQHEMVSEDSTDEIRGSKKVKREMLNVYINHYGA